MLMDGGAGICPPMSWLSWDSMGNASCVCLYVATPKLLLR